MQHEQLDLFRHLKAFLRPTRAAAPLPKARAELAPLPPEASAPLRQGAVANEVSARAPSQPEVGQGGGGRGASRPPAEAQRAAGVSGASLQPLVPSEAATKARPRVGDGFGAAQRRQDQAPAPAPEVRAAPAGPGALPAAPSPEALRAPRTVASREELLVKADRVARAVSTELGVPVRLRVTDNRSTMVSFKRQEKSLALRLHHMFLDAPPAVLKAVADYAGRGKGGAGKVLDGFIHEAQERIRAGRRKSAPLLPSGRHFELQDIFDRMNEAHFQGGIRASIGWGRPTTKRRRRSIRLGVYDHHAREIRVHPSLDRPDVPLFFVEYIVFHEMLHQLFPSSRSGGRAVHHPRAFRDRERAYPQYGLAIAWEKQHLEQLLRR